MIHAVCFHSFGITVECGKTIDVEPTVARAQLEL